jgi:hypothetical protein
MLLEIERYRFESISKPNRFRCNDRFQCVRRKSVIERTRLTSNFEFGLCEEPLTLMRPKMIIRNAMKLTMLIAAASFACCSGDGLQAQQLGSTGCASCGGNTVNFVNSTNAVITSSPIVSSPISMPTQSPSAIYSTPGYETSSTTYPAGTFANATVSGSPIVSNPAETFTSAAPAYSPSVAYAQPIYRPAPATYVQPAYSSAQQTYTASATSFSQANVSTGLAQRKARQAAQGRIRGHIGGGLGGAKYEGVGWSSQSAQQAIQQCCYWGTRPTAQIGVSRGADGVWYACVLYN